MYSIASSGVNTIDTQLYQYCKDGNLNRVKLLLQLGASANVQDLDTEYHLSTLAAAALRNTATANKKQREIVTLLLQNGADPGICSKSGMNILHYCAQYSQDHRMLKLILGSKKVDTNVQNNKGDTALHYLCKYETVSSIALSKAKYLIHYGADPTLLNSERESPLCIAAYKAKSKLLAILLTKSVNPNGHLLAQCTPIDNVAKGYVHHSDKENHFTEYYNCIDILQANGANINIKRLSGFQPLFYTLRFRSFAMTKFLLSRGSNPNAMDINGHTPLSKAYSFCTTLLTDLGDIDKILFNAGANPNIKTRDERIPASYIHCSGFLNVNHELWFQKIRYNFQAGLKWININSPRESITSEKINTLPVYYGWYNDIDLLHNCGFIFDLDLVLQHNNNVKIEHIKYVENLQRQPKSLQNIAAYVIRINLKPNAIKGTKLLDPPGCLSGIITLGYL